MADLHFFFTRVTYTSLEIKYYICFIKNIFFLYGRREEKERVANYLIIL